MTLESGYLFAYFTSADEPDGEQVRFALSDGDRPDRWQAIRGGGPMLRSTVGERGVRDPFLLRRPDGAGFFLLATDLRIAGRNSETAWEDCIRHGSRSIVVWSSPDLITWSEPSLLPVAPPSAGNAWAPEATYDTDRDAYFVYWASTMYDDTQPRTHQHGYHRTFAGWTTDFREIADVHPWIDKGWSVIDATVIEHGGEFYRFSKDERSPDSSTSGSKFITVERSHHLDATEYELLAEGIGSGSVVHGEGPIVVHGPDGWYLYIDEFGVRGYVGLFSESLESPTWRPLATTLPPGASHGSILALTPEETSRLRDAFHGASSSPDTRGPVGAIPRPR